MIELAIVVEGQTEERFVKDVLGPHLLEHGVDAVPILIGSGRPQGGGNVNVDDLANDLCNALDQVGAATSLVDLYEFADRRGRTAKRLEKVVRRKVMKRHDAGLPVRPHVQVYEFESLLFSDPEAFRIIRTIPRRMEDEIIEKLRRIRNTFPNPEDINDGEHSAPSKRLKSIVPSYSKRIHGIQVARKTGIRKISDECRQFRKWLNWMERLGGDRA